MIIAKILATLLVLAFILSPVGYLCYRAYKLAQLERWARMLEKRRNEL